MIRKSWIIIVAALTLTACGEDEGQRVPIGDDTAAVENRGRASWPAELTTQVDSANLAYSEGRYEEAAAIYHELSREYTDVGAVWFGLYMAEHALGNDEVADSALARAEAIAPGLGSMHETAESSGMGDMLRDRDSIMQQMPGGHPPLDSMPTEDAGTEM